MTSPATRGRMLLDRLVGWSPVLLLGGLAALTWWLDAQIQPLPSRNGGARHEPDLIVANFRAVMMDEKGRPAQKLEAREARHYPDDGVTAFLDPRLELTQEGRPRLTVRATSGRVTGDRENVFFEGDVRAVRDAEKAADGGTNGPFTVTGEYLHVMPSLDKVQSNKPVTVEEPRGIIRANGFVLDNRAKTIEMRSGLTGTIEPQATPK